MPTQCLSLSELAGHLEPYELLPAPISDEMKLNIRRTLIAYGISIPFFAWVPEVLTTIAYSWHGFFAPAYWLQFPADIASNIALAAGISAEVLLPLNILCLAILGVVLWKSHFLTKPVEEAYHWLAGIVMIPAGISAIVATAATVSFLTNIVMTVAIWVCLFILALIVVSIGFGLLIAAASV